MKNIFNYFVLLVGLFIFTGCTNAVPSLFFKNGSDESASIGAPNGSYPTMTGGSQRVVSDLGGAYVLEGRFSQVYSVGTVIDASTNYKIEGTLKVRTQ